MRRFQGFIAAMTAGLLVAALAPAAGAQSPAPNQLAGTDWLLGSVEGTPVVSGTNATLLFAEQEVGGNGGCNRFFTDYTTDGVSALSFGPIGSTRMACDEATNALEQSYFTALGAVTGYTLGDGTLELTNATGEAELTFGATAQTGVEGPWTITMWNNGKGGVEPVPDGVSATISFNPDGTVEGFGGCNGFGGGYSVDGDSIAIGPLMGTMMFCENVGDFESQLLIDLQAATTWSVNAGTLDLRDDTGAQMVEATSALGN